MQPIVILMGVVFAALWSSAFATARVIVAHAPPLTALSVRFAISGVLALVLAWGLGQRIAPGRAQWRSIALFGLLQNGAYLGLNFVALTRVEASLAAIIASSMPLIVAAIGAFAGDERLGRLGLAGLGAGLAGVVLIMGSRLTGGAPAAGVLACVGGAAALALATRTARRAAAGGAGMVAVVGWQMLVGSAALALVAGLTETPYLDPAPAFFAAFTWQILMPGLAATLIWFALIARIGAIRAAAFHFLNPVFGLAVAAVLLGERIGPLDLLGVAVASAGIAMVQMARIAR